MNQGLLPEALLRANSMIRILGAQVLVLEGRCSRAGRGCTGGTGGIGSGIDSDGAAVLPVELPPGGTRSHYGPAAAAEGSPFGPWRGVLEKSSRYSNGEHQLRLQSGARWHTHMHRDTGGYIAPLLRGAAAEPGLHCLAVRCGCALSAARSLRLSRLPDSECGPRCSSALCHWQWKQPRRRPGWCSRCSAALFSLLTRTPRSVQRQPELRDSDSGVTRERPPGGCGQLAVEHHGTPQGGARSANQCCTRGTRTKFMRSP
jgi:hypothetical protein